MPETVFVALVVAALTVIGPLGTSDTMPTLRRLQYFATTAGVMFPLCYGMGAAVLYLTRSASLVTIASSVAVATLVQGLACTAAVHTADSLFRPLDEHRPLSTIFLNVTSVHLLCSLFAHYIVFQRVSTEAARSGERSTQAAGTESEPDAPPVSRDLEQPRTTQPTATTPDPERFYGSLSRTVSRDVVYLKVNDHYVDVHTTGGSCLVHMRFSDAMRDLGDLGLQAHRSYWVARRHLVGIEEHDGRPMVRVTGGHLVPVSRAHLPPLRDALRGSAGEAAQP